MQARLTWSQLHAVISMAAMGVLALLVVSSLIRPEFPYDSWAYHFPFSAVLWNIRNAREVLIFSEWLNHIYAGFPLLAEYLQGALWKISGTLNATTLINSVAVVAFIAAASLKTPSALPVLTFGSLSLPLVVLGSKSSYIDVFVAMLICFQVLAAITLEREARDTTEPRVRWRSHLWLGTYVIAAGAAGNSKFMALIVSLSISVFFFFYLMTRRKSFSPWRFNMLMLAILVASVVSLGTALKNMHQHNNPFYPVAIDVKAANIHFPGPIKEYRNYPDYTEHLGLLARPVNWMLSITELDWKIRGVPSTYTIDSHKGDAPERYGPARTGGYWGVLMIASLLLSVVLASLAIRRNPRGLRSNMFFWCLFGFLSLLTSFMPQSHELRYYLYWPILLLFGICLLIEAAQLTSKTRIAISIAYLIGFVMSQHMLRLPLLPVPYESDVRQMESSAEVRYARAAGAICLGSQYTPHHFKYSAVFHGGNYVVEWGEPCVRFPEFNK